MDIKERVYTLGFAKKDKLAFISRDGRQLECPHHKNFYCGEWCPAFQLYNAQTELNLEPFYCVTLKCFPQPVSFEISEVSNEP